MYCTVYLHAACKHKFADRDKFKRVQNVFLFILTLTY